MSNTIKNYIKEIEQKRQKMIIENSIIKKRFALVESFDSLFSEIKYLNKQSFDCNNINENLLQVLNSMFQDDGKSFMDTVKSKLASAISSWQLNDFPTALEYGMKALEISPNDEMRNQFFSMYVPKIHELGLTLPDPDLKKNEDGTWTYSDPDWDEFWAVVKGNGKQTHPTLP